MIDVRIAPWVFRRRIALEIGAIPGTGVCRFLHQCRHAFRAAGIRSVVEKKQIQRGRKGFDLNSGRLDLRLREIAEHARTNQTDDEPDNRQDNQHFDENKASLPGCGKRTRWPVQLFRASARTEWRRLPALIFTLKDSMKRALVRQAAIAFARHHHSFHMFHGTDFMMIGAARSNRDCA